MEFEPKDKPCCPQCATTVSGEWQKFKDLQISNAEYFTLEIKYCPICKFVYYSDIDFS